jgi:DNA-binding Xre family transcriptional regulator
MLFDNFAMYFPSLAENTITYEELNSVELVAKLNNGRALLYDDIDHSFRMLPANSVDMTEDECRAEFGWRLRKIMYRNGITQEELSKRTGIAQARISNYLRGKNSPTFYVVDRIAKALGCSVDEFRYI